MSVRMVALAFAALAALITIASGSGPRVILRGIDPVAVIRLGELIQDESSERRRSHAFQVRGIDFQLINVDDGEPMSEDCFSIVPVEPEAARSLNFTSAYGIGSVWVVDVNGDGAPEVLASVLDGRGTGATSQRIILWEFASTAGSWKEVMDLPLSGRCGVGNDETMWHFDFEMSLVGHDPVITQVDFRHQGVGIPERVCLVNSDLMTMAAMARGAVVRFPHGQPVSASVGFSAE